MVLSLIYFKIKRQNRDLIYTNINFLIPFPLQLEVKNVVSNFFANGTNYDLAKIIQVGSAKILSCCFGQSYFLSCKVHS